MSHSHLLAAITPTPESQILAKKAVSVVHPVNAKVSFITFTADPGMYNQFTAPMMENLRELMRGGTRESLNELVRQMDHPTEEMTIVCGELGHHAKGFYQLYEVDLVIYGNYSHPLSSRATCSAKSVAGNSGADVLLASLEKS